MATHGMIDLETLGVDPDTAIMTLGAVKFDPYTNAEPHSELYMRLDVEEQTETYNRTINDDTLAWWASQSQAIQDEAFGDHDRVTVDEFTNALNRWCVGLDQIWCQGPTFDFVILTDFYRMAGKPCPWNYWQIRDSRTLFALMPVDPRKSIQEELHNALADSYYQAKCVQQTYKHFGVVH
jgi:hypothetical protein